MKSISRLARLLPLLGLFLAVSAHAQTFRVQCPTSTLTHPDGSSIKCQQISGGDGYATMADGTTIYLFGFGPLSGLNDIYNGQPGTEVSSTFNTTFGPITATPSNLVGMPDGTFTFNGAIGLTQDVNLDPWIAGVPYPIGVYVRTNDIPAANGHPAVPAGIYRSSTAGTSGNTSPGSALPAPAVSPCKSGTFWDGGVCWAYQGNLLDGHVDPRAIMDVGVMNANEPAPLIAIDEDDELFLTLTNVGMIMRPDLFEQHTVHFHGYPNASAFYDGVPDASVAINIGGSFSYYYLAPDAGTYFWHCHITPPEHLQMGMVGQLFVRPRQNKVSGDIWAAVNRWEALSATPPSTPLPATPYEDPNWQGYFEALRKRCGNRDITKGAVDVLCSTPPPATDNGAANDGTKHYAYNDGDGTTYYDVEYPIQMMGFDPNFHFVGMTFNAEDFIDMKDKYFLLNGRSYPDTIGGHVCSGNDQGALGTACANAGADANVNGQVVVAGPMETQSSDGTYHSSQPLPTVINVPCTNQDTTNHICGGGCSVQSGGPPCTGGSALLRISDLNVTEEHTLATIGIPMRVIAWNARLLRDLAGNDLSYLTNSITIGGGESADVMLDATGLKAGQKYYLYTPNLDHLSNDAENFGGMMTEINVCNSVDPQTKVCT